MSFFFFFFSFFFFFTSPMFNADQKKGEKEKYIYKKKRDIKIQENKEYKTRTLLESEKDRTSVPLGTVETKKPRKEFVLTHAHHREKKSIFTCLNEKNRFFFFFKKKKKKKKEKKLAFFIESKINRSESGALFPYMTKKKKEVK